jgi:hypothetical protein
LGRPQAPQTYDQMVREDVDRDREEAERKQREEEDDGDDQVDFDPLLAAPASDDDDAGFQSDLIVDEEDYN